MKELLHIIRSFLKNRERNIFIVFQFLNAFLSILFGKFVALNIDPESFGRFNIQNAVYFFVFSLLFQPFLQYIKANYLSIKHNATFAHLLKFYCGFLLASIVILIALFRLYFNESFLIILFVIFTLVFNSVFVLMNDFYSLKAKFLANSMLGFYKNLLPIIVLLLFVFAFGFAPKDGYIILWIAQISGFLLAVYYMFRSSPFTFQRAPEETVSKVYKDLMRYITPLIILSFWNWANTYADRFIIEKYLGLDVLGIYNANIGLGSKVFLMLNPLFLTLLTPVVFDSTLALSERKNKINFYLKIYLTLVIVAGLFVYVSQDIIGMVFLSEVYKSGFYLIFWSCISFGIITAGYLLEMIFYANNNTKVILYANIISTILIVGLNFFFLSRFGLPAAAFALFTASVLKFLYLRIIYSLTK